MLIVIALLLAAILFVLALGQNSGFVLVQLLKIAAHLVLLGVCLAILLVVAINIHNPELGGWIYSVGQFAVWPVGAVVAFLVFQTADKQLRAWNVARQLRRQVQQRVL